MTATKRRTTKKTKPKPKPKKVQTRRSKPLPASRPTPPPPEPPPVNPELEVYLRINEQENAAKKRVAAFMERTLNVEWMRRRAGSFEAALLGGLRNLLTESAKDLVDSSMPESREAVCFFLFGLLSSLRTVFYREAMHARIESLARQRGHIVPTDEDTADAVFEARVFNNAAQREVVLEKFRVSLALAPARQKEDIDRLLEQAKLYDTLNANKGMPKA